MTRAGRSKSVSRFTDFYGLSCCFSKGSNNNPFNCGTSKHEENGILDVSKRYTYQRALSPPLLRMRPHRPNRHHYLGGGHPFVPPSLSDAPLNISLIRYVQVLEPCKVHLKVFRTRWVLSTVSRKLLALFPVKGGKHPQSCSERRGHQMSLFLYPAKEGEPYRGHIGSPGLQASKPKWCWLSSTTLGIYPRGMEAYVHKRQVQGYTGQLYLQ